MGARMLKQNLQLDPATILSTVSGIIPGLAQSTDTLVNNTLSNTNQAVVGMLAGLGGNMNDAQVRRREEQEH
jgi:hypothetical protein